MRVRVYSHVNKSAVARVTARLRDKAKAYDQKATVTVGVGGEDADKPALRYDGTKSDATLGQVARWQEYGTDTIPERGVVRGWFDLRVEQMRSGLADAVRRHYVTAWAQRMAEELRGLIKQGAADLYAPLADATKAARGRAGVRTGPALYATGQLVEAVKARVSGEVVDVKSPGYSKLGGR